MCFPNSSEVNKTLYVDCNTLKACGDVVCLSPWSDIVGSEGVQEVFLVKVSWIPQEKCCAKNVAVVCGLVGIPFEIDISTLYCPSHVRAKIGLQECG